MSGDYRLVGRERRNMEALREKYDRRFFAGNPDQTKSVRARYYGLEPWPWVTVERLPDGSLTRREHDPVLDGPRRGRR